jgi:hypothetical protein
MNRTLLSLYSLIIVSVCILASRKTQADEVVKLTGEQVAAVRIAEADFKKKHASVSGYPRHYTVELERHGRELEVVFVPNQAPLGPHEAGTGGGNIYGPEVAYFVSLDRFNIIRFHFAR